MSIFTPYVGTPPDPNYLGYSKSPDKIEANKTWGRILDNSGDMLETGIKGLDDLDRRVIDKEANESFRVANQSEIERLEKTYRGIKGEGPTGTPLLSGMDAKGGADATGGQALPFADEVSSQSRKSGNTDVEESAGQPLPPAANRQLNYLDKVGQAGLAGKLSPTGAQMNGEAILSDLLQRYPSRANMIKTIASKYGFGEGRYAATLRQEINQWQQQATAKDNKDETWENSNRDTLMAIDPNYFNRPKDERRSQDARDFYQTKIGNIEWVKKSNEIQKGQLDLDVSKAKEEELALKTDRVWTDRRATDFGIKFEALTSQVLGTPGVNNLDDFMTKLRENGKYLNDPKVREELGSKLEQFKVAFKDESVRLASREKVGKEGGKQYTYLQLLKKDGLDKTDDTVLTAINSLQKWIDNKGSQASFDAAGRDARVATAYTDASMLKVLSTVPTASAMKSWRDIVGEGVWGEQYKQSDSTLKQPVDKGMRLALDITTDNVGTGNPDPRTKKPETLADTVNRYVNDWQMNGKGGKIKPQDLAAILDRGHGMLMSNTMPIETQTRFGKYLFSDANLLNQLNDSDKRKFLNTYTSPATTDRIYNLGDPELIEKYKGVVQNMVVSTTQQTVSNIKAVTQRASAPGTTGTAFDARPYYNLTFNPKSNRIEGNFATNDQLYSELGTTPTRYGSIKQQVDTVRKSVDQLNQVLSVYAPILQREKTTISPEITTMFEQMGIKLPVEEGTGKRSDAGGDTQVADITNINPASLQMQTPAPKVNTKINPNYPTGVKISQGFADEDLPPSGSVASLDSFLANPLGTKGKRKPTGNLTNQDIDWDNIKVDDIPEGMSARDFLSQLKNKRNPNGGVPVNAVEGLTANQASQQFQDTVAGTTINKDNWDKMLKEIAPSTNIEDRRTPSDLEYENLIHRFLTNSDLSKNKLSDDDISKLKVSVYSRILNDEANQGDMDAYDLLERTGQNNEYIKQLDLANKDPASFLIKNLKRLEELSKGKKK